MNQGFKSEISPLFWQSLKLTSVFLHYHSDYLIFEYEVRFYKQLQFCLSKIQKEI